MEWITSAEGWAALLTLAVLEIVLGIDNIIFIALLAGKLPADQRERARRTGLFLAMFIRIGLLLSIVWVMGLTRPLVQVAGVDLSGRSLILAGGGLFLLYKSTREIHDTLEGSHADAGVARQAASFVSVIVQILLLDIVFSLDSIITAVGLAQQVEVMIAAVIPCFVVPRQNNSIARDGKFAEAAILNAHPTRKFTFIFSKAIPKRIAIPPTTTAESFATRT